MCYRSISVIVIIIMRSTHLLSLLALLALTQCLFDITKFGAVANSDSVPDQFRNQQAILAALSAANASAIDRVVRIPAHKFYSMPIRVTNMHNVSIYLEGRLIASKNVRHWPRQHDVPTYF
jgi:hypothetical protein